VLGELCATGLLWEMRQQPEPVFRFRHALIQEATYQGMLRAQRRQLHARAAWELEAVSADRLEEVAAALGHRFAAAGETGRAVHHLEIARDHAASVFANDEAIASYRYALAIMDRADPTGPEAGVQLQAKLVEVLWLTGRHSEARNALQAALVLVDAGARGGPLQVARLHARLGRVEVADHNYDAALASFDAAEGLLGDGPANQDEDEDQAVIDLRLEIEVDGRATLHYWRNEPERAAAVLARTRPLLEARGTPARRMSFYLNMALQRARETRYRIDDEILTNARAAVAAAQHGGEERDVAWTAFCLGFVLLWYGDLEEAEEQLASEALGLWGTTVVSYSWYWLCLLWPLIAVHLSRGQVGKALEASRRMAGPSPATSPRRSRVTVGCGWGGLEPGGSRHGSRKACWGTGTGLPSRLRLVRIPIVDLCHRFVALTSDGPAWLVGSSTGGGVELDTAPVSPELLAGLLLLAPRPVAAPLPTSMTPPLAGSSALCQS